ncbi:MAG: hypothetical protein WCR06_08465 [bacterium]
MARAPLGPELVAEWRTGHRKLVRTGQELLETDLAITMADVQQATVFRYRKHAD